MYLLNRYILILYIHMPQLNKHKAEKLYNKYFKQMKKIVGNTTTYSSTLYKVGKKLFGNNFIGVFTSDNIPTIPNAHMCIVNLDTSKQSGSHWVGIIKDKGRILIYDSFGRKAIKILSKVKNIDKYIDTELDKEQDISESNCGARCLAYLMVYHKHGYTYAKWI